MTENTQPATSGKKYAERPQTTGRRTYNSTTSQGNRGSSNPTRLGSTEPRVSLKPKPRVNKSSSVRGSKPSIRRKPTKDELLKQKEKKQRQERLEKTYVRLHEAFPNAFDRTNVKPLKRDIHKEIFEFFHSENEPFDSPVKKTALRSFLTRYIRSDVYHHAVIKYGKRFNLDGSEDLPFTEEEIQYHRENIRKKPKQPPRRSAGKRTVVRGAVSRPGFVPRSGSARPGQRVSFSPRNGTTKEGVTYRTPRPSSSFIRSPVSVRPQFKPGDQVFCGGNRKGVVKEVLANNSVKVQLDDNKFSLIIKTDQIKHV